MEAVTIPESYRLYFHYLSVPGQTYITFLEWIKQEHIETIPDEHTKRLIELTGYPGHTTADEVYAWAKNKVSEIWDFLNGLFDRIDDAISAALGNVHDWLQNIFRTLANVVNSIVGFVSNFAASIVSFISKAAEWITSTFEWAVTLIQNTINNVAAWIENAIYSVGEALDKIITWVGTALEQAVDWVGETITTLSTNIWNWIKTLANSIATTVSALASDIWDWFEQTYKTISVVVEKVGTWFIEAVQVVGGWIAEQAAAFAEDWRDMIVAWANEMSIDREQQASLWSIDPDDLKEQIASIMVPIVKLQLEMSELIAKGTLE